VKTVQRYFSLAVLLALTSVALADPYSQTWEESNAPAAAPRASSEYTLSWQDAGKESLPGKPTQPVVEAPVAVNLAELPALIAAHGGVTLPAGLEVASAVPLESSSRRALRGPSSVSVPTHDVVLHAERYYDNWADNYRYVNKVEVVTYRGGYPTSDVYENVAQYSTYDVYINDLKPGDRYEVRVTWDDGTYRTLERSVDRHPEHNVRISEPS
jgi:hypothetical protein